MSEQSENLTNEIKMLKARVDALERKPTYPKCAKCGGGGKIRAGYALHDCDACNGKRS